MTDAPAKALRAKPGPPEDLSGQHRIRRGRNAIDARLDLHGYTQDTASRKVSWILLHPAGACARCVRIMTRKGRPGAGILRARVCSTGSRSRTFARSSFARSSPAVRPPTRASGAEATYTVLRSG